MLKVERPTVQQNLNFITINIALEGGGEAQSLFHMGSLIIFVRDCRLMYSIISDSQFIGKARLTYLYLLWQLISGGQFFKGRIKTKPWFIHSIEVECL